MSDAATKRMLEAYIETAEPTQFLSGFFRSPRRNFHNSQNVEMDIQRSGEKIAVAVKDLSTGNRKNSVDLYTNKEFTPPIFKEEAALNAFDLNKRQAGENPFEDPNFQLNATRAAMRSVRLMEDKIRRSIELQAAQVFQSGIVDLKDSAGVTQYQIDYKPKATHFPTVTTDWSNPAADVLNDLQSLAGVIRVDGKARPDTLIMGEGAFNNFINNDNVQALADNRRITVGAIEPANRGEGAVFQGFFWAGNYRFAIWTYPEYYEDPQTSVATKYVADDKVIMLSSAARFDATFGSIPRITPPDARAARFIPPRIANTRAGMDMSLNAWFSPNGEQLFVSAGTRPLMIPTSIDRYGCLDTIQ